MFLARRPSVAAIDRFLLESRELPLSYRAVGVVSPKAEGPDVHEWTFRIGDGERAFERATAALRSWKQFDLGWVEVYPRTAPLAVGTVVAVLIRHFGFWSLNGCRIVYSVDAGADDRRFGFAYGTLTNHAESGEELFEVFLDRQTEAVIYRIRAASWPQAALTYVGQPIVRALQARFRSQSADAMERATRSTG